MSKTKRTAAGAALTGLILDLFRLNSRMLASGDRLVADSRAHQRALADPGQHRRGRAAAAGGLAGARPRRQPAERPAHRQRPGDGGPGGLRGQPASPAGAARRADRQGQETYEAAMRLQAPWVNGLAEGLTAKDLEATPASSRRCVASWRATATPTSGTERPQ